MSYILDALKKNEQERDLGQVPGIDAVQEKPHSSQNRRWKFWLVPVLVINLGVLIWLGTGYQRGERSAPVPVSDVTAPTPGAVASGSGPVQDPEPERVSAPEATPPVRQPPPRITPVAPVVPAQSAATRVAPVSPDTASRQALSVTGDPVASDDIPLWEELAPDLRRSINRPELDVHVYAAQPARRFILVSLQKYREGDRLPDGMQVERILPTGAVFVADGQRFRIERH